MTKVDAFEIIKLDNLVLRHFVTNNLNELYEDENGDIYVSADKKGIYKISFLTKILIKALLQMFPVCPDHASEALNKFLLMKQSTVN